jgi:predicted CxxxxCH...CXXCH cytochrome family protein
VVVNHVNASGNSVPGWVTPTGGLHANSATMNYIANGGSSSCTECHGSDLAGGISRVSCFGNPAGCHHGPIGDWISTSPPQNHGISAKKAPGSSGFASCQICHGSNFSGGGANVSCFTCHGVSAPHAPKPWRASAGSLYDHVTTDKANAPVCYTCHAYTGTANPRNPHAPPSPAPAGTAPGCFNGTMCHSAVAAPHPLGNPAWETTPPAAQPHGNAAKATLGSTTGFAYCQACHGAGTDFAGGSSGVSCYTCHGVSAPHAAKPWRASAGSTYTHTTTVETGNAAVCAFCHFPGSPNNPASHPATPAPAGTPPGCFTNTLCHGSSGAPHPVPYNNSSHFTVTAATFPANCSACHDVSAPTVKPGPACQTCHTADSPLTALNCTSCHADPPSGATSAYPNAAGAHAKHIALNAGGTPVDCDTCHNGLGTNTLNHYNRANARPGKNALRVPPGDAAFLTTYNAKTGASSFDNSALSCSNVSCHGGQTTPNWQTGALDVTTQCTSCHAFGTAQYNSFNSGEHQVHVVEESLLCTFCHLTTTLAVNHFTALGTTTMEGPASATIGGTGTAIVSWNPTTKSCSPICHETRTW